MLHYMIDAQLFLQLHLLRQTAVVYELFIWSERVPHSEHTRYSTVSSASVRSPQNKNSITMTAEV
jgi:hypothetical protein